MSMKLRCTNDIRTAKILPIFLRFCGICFNLVLMWRRWFAGQNKNRMMLSCGIRRGRVDYYTGGGKANLWRN